ncbi:DUF2271 domain-containing protein [Spongorhabdus nitratireducens]
MTRKSILQSLFLIGVLLTGSAGAQTVSIELVLPNIKSGQYQRPYTAVWLEKDGERRAVSTIAVWHEDKKWLKDLRRWWRKAGRYNPEVDGVSGATRPAGTHLVSWQAQDANGKPLAGDYLLCLEAVREHGNRTLLKQKIHLGDGARKYSLSGGKELGLVNITLGK